MSSITELFEDLINLMKIKKGGHPVLFTYLLSQIRQAESTFATIAADTGSATASTSDDTFTISGGDNVTTSISGTTLTIDIGYFLEYKGTHDASTTAYPTSPEKGDIWIVSTAGTISGTYYAIADWMVYNGTSWDKIEASSVISDDAYNATSWNGVTHIAPSKNAVRDWIEALSYLSNIIEDTSPQLGGELDCQGNDITAINLLSLNETSLPTGLSNKGIIYIDTGNFLKFVDENSHVYTIEKIADYGFIGGGFT